MNLAWLSWSRIHLYLSLAAVTVSSTAHFSPSYFCWFFRLSIKDSLLIPANKNLTKQSQSPHANETRYQQSTLLAN